MMTKAQRYLLAHAMKDEGMIRMVSPVLLDLPGGQALEGIPSRNCFEACRLLLETR